MSSDEEEDAEEQYEGEEGDFLQDWPDDTEVNSSRDFLLGYILTVCSYSKDLELVHSRISSLDELRLARFASHLKRLCLRQNHISVLDAEVFQHLTKLEELDLYDNKIKDPGHALDHLSNLS